MSDLFIASDFTQTELVKLNKALKTLLRNKKETVKKITYVILKNAEIVFKKAEKAEQK